MACLSGELSELCGEWTQPRTGAAVERAKRKGSADPEIKTRANQERKNRRKKAKAKKRTESSGSKVPAKDAPKSPLEEDDDESDDKQNDGNELRLVFFLVLFFSVAFCSSCVYYYPAIHIQGTSIWSSRSLHPASPETKTGVLN